MVGKKEPLHKIVTDTYALLVMAYSELGADMARHKAPIITSNRDFSLCGLESWAKSCMVIV